MGCVMQRDQSSNEFFPSSLDVTAQPSEIQQPGSPIHPQATVKQFEDFMLRAFSNQTPRPILYAGYDPDAKGFFIRFPSGEIWLIDYSNAHEAGYKVIPGVDRIMCKLR